MKIYSAALAAGVALLILPLITQAQGSGHYIPGMEGINCGTLPLPGVYLRDYNLGYYSETFNAMGDTAARSFGPYGYSTMVYANMPRVTWITDWQVLGGYPGLDVMVPLKYTSIKWLLMRYPYYTFYQYKDHTFGLGDVLGEATWSRHWKQFDVSLGYGVWAPTGDSAPVQELTTRAGLGYWTHMLTVGATWFPDEARNWSVSALNHYEFNMDLDGISIGQVYTLEWGVSRAIVPHLDAGLSGYYQVQTTLTEGTFPGGRVYAPLASVVALGPEIDASCPKYNVDASLRYAYEFLAYNRWQGHTIALTLTKKF